MSYIRRARAPELPVVILEDFGALIGLVVALVCVDDGRGHRQRRLGRRGLGRDRRAAGVRRGRAGRGDQELLIGEGAGPRSRRRSSPSWRGDEVDRVIHMRTLHIGPEELLVAAKIAVTHDDTAAEVARGIDAAESRIREAVPMARHIYIEPDLDRARAKPVSPADAAPGPGPGRAFGAGGSALGRRGGDQAGLVGEHHRLGAVAQAELGEHPRHVRLHRVLAHHQAAGDLGVGQAAGDQPSTSVSRGVSRLRRRPGGPALAGELPDQPPRHLRGEQRVAARRPRVRPRRGPPRWTSFSRKPLAPAVSAS